MKWKVFIVTHGPIIEEYYKKDPLFSKEHYTFLNVSNTPIEKREGIDIIELPTTAGFVKLGKWWAETEAMYNIYLSGAYADYDYIGFIHWDHELKIAGRSGGHDVTKLIDSYLEPGLKSDEFIAFQSIDFSADFNQHIMMDERYPDKLTGGGKNCWETIVKDYNDHFGTAVTLDDLRGKRICISSAFMCGRESFEKIMSFYSYVIKKGYLDKFDVSHKYRFQGGMMERYAGMFFHDFKLIDIPLIHHTRFDIVKFLKYLIYHYFWRFLPIPKRYV